MPYLTDGDNHICSQWSTSSVLGFVRVKIKGRWQACVHLQGGGGVVRGLFHRGKFRGGKISPPLGIPKLQLPRARILVPSLFFSTKGRKSTVQGLIVQAETHGNPPPSSKNLIPWTPCAQNGVEGTNMFGRVVMRNIINLCALVQIPPWVIF